MPIVRPVLYEIDGNPVLLPGLLVPSGAYYTLIPLAPAAHAAAHAAAGSDPLTLSQSQITNLVADLAAKAALAGATFTGAVQVKTSLRVNDATNANEHFLVNTTSLGHTGYPRALAQGGNSAADANWLMRFASAYSHSGLTIPAGLQVSSNKDANYTNSHSVMLYQNATLGSVSTFSGAGNNGTQLRLGTHATPSSCALLIDTVAAGQGVSVDSSLKVGASGTAITQQRGYTPALTPALIAAMGVTEQTFAVAGLTTADTVIVNGPAAAAGTALVHARVSAADTLALTWQTTGAGLTPTAGTYRVFATRW